MLEGFDPASGQAQSLYNDLRGLDDFNWGYDPFHFTAPEGSYASNAEGVQRIIEFRQMVQALADNGLATVMDVVYNHTNASGLADKSVLDRSCPVTTTAATPPPARSKPRPAARTPPASTA